MSLSSQSGPSQQPNHSQPRRLQTPEERFGKADSLPVEPAPAPVPDPFVALPASPRPRSQSARLKKRHERHRFEREAHHLDARRTNKARTAKPTAPPSSSTPAGAPKTQAGHASPTLQRIHANRRRFWKRLGTLTALLILASAGAAALYAPQMNIERVSITGLHATSPELVKPIAARLLGHNVFRADKTVIARSVEQLPTVKSARVVMHEGFPPRVEVRVVERKPIVRVGKGNSWWAVDESGNPYRTANAHDARLLALTWSGPIQTLKPLDKARWAGAVRLTEAVTQNQAPSKNGEGLGQIRAMQLDESGDATLQIAAPDGAGDMTIKLGNDSWSEKLERARIAWAYFARTKRKARELNLISLDLPRWTARDASVENTSPPST